MSTPSTDREIEKRLAAHAARYTRGRRAVVAALARSDGPRSAAELSVDLGPAVPVSSLYRSLTVLEEAGVVVPHFGARGLTRYELAEWLQGHHHHLICIDCGSVEDVEVPASYESQVEDLVVGISATAAFTPRSHALEIEGRCARCA